MSLHLICKIRREMNIFINVSADGPERIKFITENVISDCEGYS